MTRFLTDMRDGLAFDLILSAASVALFVGAVAVWADYLTAVH